MSNQIFATERLTLNAFTLEDTDFIIELVNSEGWLKNIGDKNIKNNADALAYLQTGPLQSYAKYGHGLSKVVLKESGTPIGMCGIVHRDLLEHPDIGFAFLPAYLSKGYAYEIAAATLLHAQTVWQMPTILAITLPTNQRSIRLLEKIGLTLQREISFPPSTETLLLYYKDS